MNDDQTENRVESDAATNQGSGLTEQLIRAVAASEAGHEPFCMSILRGKDCDCGFDRGEDPHADAEGT